MADSEPESDPQSAAPRLALTRLRPSRHRYGNARITVRAGSNWDDLFGPTGLAEALRKFERRDLPSEDVAWAFVRSRVSEPSPTFDWSEARLDRLLAVVCDASVDPPFEETDPETVAATLLASRDAASERLSRASKVLAGAIPDLSRLTAVFDRQHRAISRLAAGVEESMQRPFLDIAERLKAVTVPPPNIIFESAGATRLLGLGRLSDDWTEQLSRSGLFGEAVQKRLVSWSDAPEGRLAHLSGLTKGVRAEWESAGDAELVKWIDGVQREIHSLETDAPTTPNAAEALVNELAGQVQELTTRSEAESVRAEERHQEQLDMQKLAIIITILVTVLALLASGYGIEAADLDPATISAPPIADETSR